MTKLTAADGHSFDVYEVRPDDAAAAVVVIQEIFGVNEHIRSVVDRYASFGYHAVAPALFDRVRPGVELDYDSDGMAQGREMAGAIRWEPAMLDLAATVDHVASTGPVGTVGYCFGGGLAWLTAHELSITAAVGYYGGPIHSLIDKAPKVPVQLHFGELDHAIPLEQVDEIAKAHPKVDVRVYEGAQHGFHCDARGSYHPLSAAIAQGRTLEFFVANGVRP